MSQQSLWKHRQVIFRCGSITAWSFLRTCQQLRLVFLRAGFSETPRPRIGVIMGVSRALRIERKSTAKRTGSILSFSSTRHQVGHTSARRNSFARLEKYSIRHDKKRCPVANRYAWGNGCLRLRPLRTLGTEAAMAAI